MPHPPIAHVHPGDHGGGGSYLVDLFRVEGGTERDYVFLGPGGDYQVTGLSLTPDGQVEREVPFALRFPVARVGELSLGPMRRSAG